MRKIICNTILLGAFLISTQSKAQHLLEALDASGFYSTQTKSYSRNFTKNNCSVGYAGSTVKYTQTATATANSQISQADADSKASTAATTEAQRLVNEGGQAYANANGTCEVMRYTCVSYTSYEYRLYNFRQSSVVGPNNNCPRSYKTPSMGASLQPINISGSIIYSTGNGTCDVPTGTYDYTEVVRGVTECVLR